MGQGSDGVWGHREGTDGGTETGTAGAKKAAQRQPSLNCILKMNAIHQAAGGDAGEEGPQPGGQALPRIHARGGKSSLMAGCS